ncbi:MAG: hypothetical protein Q7T97_01320 [Burkholderiaceae bacterium]|nr:hypothetical protein [Burkholderiaceae bacterium]
MLRCLPLLGLVLCGLAHAVAPPHIDLTAEPAWNGWSRPGRATEIDIRVTTDTETRATLDVVSGRQAVHADLDLQPGRTLRLQIPVNSAERVAVTLGSQSASPERRDIGVSLSESPMLGVALVAGDPVELEGFHTLVLAADDLPRNASAYSSIDALIVDAPTLGALDQRQLAALLEHAAGCGRIVVLNPNARLRHVLDGAAGCGGGALMSAVSLVDATELLQASLSSSTLAAISPGVVGELNRPAPAVWHRVALCLAFYFAAAALAILFFSSLPLLLLTPVLAAAAALALLHATEPSSQLVIWSEGESGARFARYQASQWFPGLVRERRRVSIPPQLASSSRPCSPSRAMRFDFDASRSRATFAEFETRLFDQASLCYAGSFPTTRTFEVQQRPDGSRDVLNAGTMAWPPGWLLAGGLVHDLPALGPGAHGTIGAQSGQSPPDASVRMAMRRTPPDAVSALWALDLGGVVDAPIGSKGWLLVFASQP